MDSMGLQPWVWASYINMSVLWNVYNHSKPETEIILKTICLENALYIGPELILPLVHTVFNDNTMFKC